jgi:hypothetical protein
MYKIALTKRHRRHIDAAITAMSLAEAPAGARHAAPRVLKE